ncbi:unnamed protein product [Alternaria alternata]
MARDLSPYSARRLLTQQLVQGKTASPPAVSGGNRSPSSFSKHGSERVGKEPSIASGRPSRSRSRERKPRHLSKDDEPKEAATEPSAVRKREQSPEPYRKPRDSSRERRRDGSRERRKDRSKDRRRDRSRDKDETNQATERKIVRRTGGAIAHTTRTEAETGTGSAIAPRTDTAGEIARAPETDDEKTGPKKADVHARLYHIVPANRVLARPPHLHPLRPNRVKKALPSQEISFRGLDDSAQPPSKYGGAPPDKEKPNFKPTGALAKAANRVEGTKISLKYHEPPEARKPPASQPWRIFVFKGDDVVDTIEIWQKSCWLLGRSHEVVDYVLEHPSSSGQHAAIQFRYIQKTIEDEFGVKSQRGKVKPYIIDLESSNGTELNGEDLEASRYFELRDKDIIKFGGSEREYVVMLPQADAK